MEYLCVGPSMEYLCVGPSMEYLLGKSMGEIGKLGQMWRFPKNWWYPKMVGLEGKIPI